MSLNLVKPLVLNTLKNLNKKVRWASTYKAALLKEIGKPLEIGEKQLTKLNKTEVRIQVHYCSVNSLDCLGFQDTTRKLPFVPGYELAGEVLEIGQDVTPENAIVGERVVALSLEKFGGFAEQCVVDVGDVWRIPTDVESKSAAVLICGHSTAVFTFSKLCKPKEADHILISAGSAGLGLAAVDVAANVFKAKVIGVTDNEERGELLRNRGAFQALSFNKKLKKQITAITNKEGADIIYDAVGDYMLDSIGSCVAVGGRIFHAAPIEYKIIPAPPPNSTLTIVSLHALRQQNPELFRNIVTDTLDLADQRLIKGHISATFELKNINDAVTFIEAKKSTGKVVIEIEE